MELDLKPIITRLQNNLAIGNVALFTGAGFSFVLKNRAGRNVPVGSALMRLVWEQLFPNEPFDESMAFGDVFEAAKLANAGRLSEILRTELTIDPNSVPEWFSDYFDMPWYKVYTLNIDSTVAALNTLWQFDRSIVEVSATSDFRTESTQHHLGYYALNGTLADIPDKVTFTTSQYGARLAHPDQFYMTLATESLTIPFVYIGTQLDEDPLWQHIEMRKSKGGRDNFERRARSYLVTPTLNRAKEMRLRELNIDWLPFTAEEFHHHVLSQVQEAAKEGRKYLASLANVHQRKHFTFIREVINEHYPDTQFLLGEEPNWSDIREARAITRQFDDDLLEQVMAALKDNVKAAKHSLFAVPGTAGSGKTTSLMRLGASLNAAGQRTAWIDRNSTTNVAGTLKALRQMGSYPSAILIDDAEVFGRSFVNFVRGVYDDSPGTVVCFTVRSSIFDKYFNRFEMGDEITYHEKSVPALTDSDIDKLLDLLDAHNRLGVLKGQPRQQQKRVFKDYSGRQLLVAMLSATSGKRFDDKIVEEFTEMEDQQKRIYAVVALASTFKCSLTKADILGSIREIDNDALNSLETLIRRHLIVEDLNAARSFKLRHRLIAERLVDAIRDEGYLKTAIVGLASFVGVREGQHARSPISRMMIQILNHEFLLKNLAPSDCRTVYGDLEPFLRGNYHYWLQRGSQEIEDGVLELAENFLGQARSLYSEPGINDMIENEYAYLLFKKAISNPTGLHSTEWVEEAIEILEGLMAHGRKSPHPFHVLGSQGLSWARRGIVKREEKIKFLRFLISKVEEGGKNYTRNQDLANLLNDLRAEYLSFGLNR